MSEKETSRQIARIPRDLAAPHLRRRQPLANHITTKPSVMESNVNFRARPVN
jgi:hypothetical protein